MFDAVPPLFGEVAWRTGALLVGGACAIVLVDTVMSRRRGASSLSERQARARSSLWPRFWVWVAGTSVLLGGASLGRIGFGLLLAALSIQAAREVTGALRRGGVLVPAASVAALTCLIVLSGVRWNDAGIAGGAAASVVAALLVVLLARSGVDRRPLRTGAGLAAVGYVALPLAAIIGVLGRADGFALVSYLLIVVVLSDTCAMFGGLAFGRHRIAPVLSPGKTIEGVAAGFVGALAGAAVMQFAFPHAPAAGYYAGALVIGAAALAGDLLASAIKRRAGLADFSRFLPGHGGLMDRLDSVLAGVPALVLIEILGAFG